MKCEDPFIDAGGARPCGRCLPCLTNRARIWKHRILLESHQWAENAFVSLTYEDQFLSFVDARPYGGSGDLATLVISDYQNFLKRLRKAYAPQRFRFFLAGEYGDETWRPHYHAALFNFPTCRRGRTLRRLGRDRPIWRECCSVCQLVGETWGRGDVDLGVLEPDSAGYVCGYVTKKLTARGAKPLLGREPEFARMSLRPGIGRDALWEVADTWMRYALDTQGDVPVTLRHGSRELPLGRYLRRNLRLMVGKEANAPKETMEAIKAELQPVRDVAFENSRSVKKVLQEKEAGKIAGFHARQRIFRKRRGL